MMRWIHTLLASDGAGGRTRPKLALVSVDDGCPVCDHPFGHLTHACISAIGMATPTSVPMRVELPIANIA